MPNPRNHIKAAQETLIDLARKITAPYDGYNASSIALNNLQKCGSRNIYYDIDFDEVSVEETLPQIKENININACLFLKTYGGFHLLIELEKVEEKYRKTCQPKLTKLKGADVRGTSCMIPVPGCTQGGYVPHFVKIT